MKPTPDESSIYPTTKQPSISRLVAALLDDGRRVKVNVFLQDMTSRPDLELLLEDEQGRELARSLLMELFANTAEFTLHIRDSSAHPPLKVTAVLKSSDEQVISMLSSPVT